MTDPTPQTTPTRDDAVLIGWKLVPVEPTEEMIEAMCDAYRQTRRPGVSGMTLDAQFRAEFAQWFAAYSAMLATAPATASGRVDAAFRAGLDAAAEYLLACDDYGDRHKADEIRKIAPAATLSPAATPVSETDPVAWMDDGSTRAGTGTEFRVVTAHTKAGMPKAAAEAYTTPLYLAKPAASPAGGDVREAIEKLPRRIEPISGQRFSYVKLEDVLAVIDNAASSIAEKA